MKHDAHSEIVDLDLDLDNNVIDTCQGIDADEQVMDVHDRDTCLKTVGLDLDHYILDTCQGIDDDEHSTA